ncbi:MAG: ATP-dependent DNA helicase [Betaproteobacteria bacterium]|nr:ATP-dependent DNA helicase [Betaproteobacteria bacterium]
MSAALVARIFAPAGPLAERIPGYKARPQQVEFALRVLDTIGRTGMLVAEAGTGTGKTFAYLVPALLAGGKVIVSTGTKTLQDQLFDRDLPAVRDALASGARLALLKGRANYVCHHRLERALAEARLGSREEAAQLRSIKAFSATSRTGDRADLAQVPENAPVWMHATSTRENCLGQECPRYNDCFVVAARRDALAADVVVINHHLFFADVALRGEGLAELLPACNTVILDEAHQLPDVARLFFGETLSTTQVVELARDARMELRAAGGGELELDRQATALERGARDLRLAFSAETVKLSGAQAQRSAEFEPALLALGAALSALRELLGAQAERSEGLASCARRAEEFAGRLARWGDADAAESVCWLEVFGHSVQLHITPLSPGEIFRRHMDDHPRAWIFTSATLAVGENFSHFKRELGIDAAHSVRWESPFDFARQALLFVPQGLPQPNDPGHTGAVIEAAYPVLRAAGGGAFLLFTTLRAVRRAEELLAGRLAAEGLPLLVQGSGSRSELLERFRSLGNAVLLGSASFWEGVDVRGEALSVVVIDKLPFAPPDDPVLAARIDALRALGGNPFAELQLPQAILQLKQGVGRLIRDETDRGVLVLCDPRLFTRSYGKIVLGSLPPMRVTRDAAVATGFFAQTSPVRIASDPTTGEAQ